jgi:hypothetical protein
MWRAVLYKELRETAWIAGLALLAYLNLVAGHMGLRLFPWSGGQSGEIPFVEAAFLSSFVFISVPLVIALGLRQSTAESIRGTWLFLLHRPAEPWKLVGLKLTTGTVLYLVCAALPIAIFAWWAAKPGTHASPFDWSMTWSTWSVWFSLSAMYLGAFLAGIRPAHWFGSRLLPLAAAGLLVMLIEGPPWWWLLRPAIVLLVDAWLIACILYVARTRDY